MSDKIYGLPGGQNYELKREPDGGYSVKRESAEGVSTGVQAQAERIDHETKRLYVNRKTSSRHLFWTYAVRNKRILSWPGGSMEIDAADLTEGTASVGGAVRPLKLTMPGKVLSIKVKEGDEVEAGQGLLVVEAMKMENLLLAAAKAKVAKIHVQAGDRLESGATLITFEQA